MAKGKRTVALFEVIHKDKRMEPMAPAALKPAKSLRMANDEKRMAGFGPLFRARSAFPAVT